jgi:hypothetical protein
MSKLKLFFIFLIVTWILGTIIFVDFKKEIFDYVGSKRNPIQVKMEKPKEMKSENVEKIIPKKQEKNENTKKENVKTEEKTKKNVDMITGEKLKKIKPTSPSPGVFDVYNYQTVKVELKIDVRKIKFEKKRKEIPTVDLTAPREISKMNQLLSM